MSSRIINFSLRECVRGNLIYILPFSSIFVGVTKDYRGGKPCIDGPVGLRVRNRLSCPVAGVPQLK